MPTTIRGRAWVGTLNNCKINAQDLLNQWLADGNITYGVAQLEKGEQGHTEHVQCYVVCTNVKTRKWCNDNLFKGHWELRMGTHEQARDYCMKEATRLNGPWQVGEWKGTEEDKKKSSSKGGAATKRKLDDMVVRIREGANDQELLNEFPAFTFMHSKNVERVRLIMSQDQRRVKPYCLVLHGPTGTGKSFRARNIMENNGGGFVFRRGNSGNMWADGYDPLRHPVVIFDEMDGGFMPYRQLLRICDEYQLTLDTKGGAVNFCPKIVIFTSHKHPKEWYSVESVPDTTELMRRLSGTHGAIIEMKTPIVVQADDAPDLKDIVDLLETGELVEQVTKIMSPFDQNQEQEEEGDDQQQDEPVEVVDLIDYCDDCGQQSAECECSLNQAMADAADQLERQYEQDHDAEGIRRAASLTREALSLNRAGAVRRAAQVYCDCLCGDLPCDIAGKLRRTEEFGALPAHATSSTSWSILKPPKAPASEFKKYKQVQGQSKLGFAPRQVVNTDDDDVDDKE